MKIEYTDSLNIVDIADIEIGECFIYDAALHMKIRGDGLFADDRQIFIFPNAIIDLEHNTLNSLADGVEVSKVEAKILVNREKYKENKKCQ